LPPGHGFILKAEKSVPIVPTWNKILLKMSEKKTSDDNFNDLMDKQRESFVGLFVFVIERTINILCIVGAGKWKEQQKQQKATTKKFMGFVSKIYEVKQIGTTLSHTAS
jgi:hypothetical protein